MTKKLETHVRLHVKTDDPGALQDPESFASFCMAIGDITLEKAPNLPEYAGGEQVWTASITDPDGTIEGVLIVAFIDPDTTDSDLPETTHTGTATIN
jgi:hypothetical protein